MNAERARIYRFRDVVALSLGEGQTQYLTADFALRLAHSLRLYADDIDAVSFVESDMWTREIYDTGLSAASYRVKVQEN